MTDNNRSNDPNLRSVSIERVGLKHYRATGANDATLDFGQGEGLLTPVELLLAAIAGCSSVDVDVVTSRKSEPENFTVTSSGVRVDEDGAVRLDDIQVNFNVTFPATEDGAKAAGMVDRLIKLSHDKDCTVSRTVELPTKVEFINDNA